MSEVRGSEERHNRTRETDKEGTSHKNCLNEVSKHPNTSEEGEDSIDSN